MREWAEQEILAGRAGPGVLAPRSLGGNGGSELLREWERTQKGGDR